MGVLVDKNGDVCISILHEPGDDKFGYEKASERWLPVHTVETILISVISMLADPNDESPANVDAAVSTKLRSRCFKVLTLCAFAEGMERIVYRVQEESCSVCAKVAGRVLIDLWIINKMIGDYNFHSFRYFLVETETIVRNLYIFTNYCNNKLCEVRTIKQQQVSQAAFIVLFGLVCI